MDTVVQTGFFKASFCTFRTDSVFKIFFLVHCNDSWHFTAWICLLTFMCTDCHAQLIHAQQVSASEAHHSLEKKKQKTKDSVGKCLFFPLNPVTFKLKI